MMLTYESKSRDEEVVKLVSVPKEGEEAVGDINLGQGLSLAVGCLV